MTSRGQVTGKSPDASRSLTIDPLFSFDPPAAVNDGYSVVHDQALSIDADNGVLANDYARAGDSLSATLVSDAGHGTVGLTADGSFSYTPAVGYSGADQFTCTASAPATVYCR